MNTAELISNGKAVMGLEFGSTRIKAVLIGENGEPIAVGAHDWENRLENGIWTYSLTDIHEGIRDCYSNLVKEVKDKYGVSIKSLAAIGIVDDRASVLDGSLLDIQLLGGVGL